MPSRKGKPNKITREVRAVSQKLFCPAFWKATQKRMIEGKEPPQIVLALLAYAYGKPRTDDDKAQHTTVSIGALSVLPTLGAATPVAALDVRPVQKLAEQQGKSPQPR